MGQKVIWFHDWTDKNGTFHREFLVWSGGARVFYCVLIVVFVLGPLIGLLTAELRLPFARLVHLLHLHPLSPAPTAWDSVFFRSESRYVVVHTIDKKQFPGVFGTNSYAGFSSGARDLYLEAQWFTDPFGNFMEDGEITTGIYFPADQISHIEFLPSPQLGEEPEADEAEARAEDGTQGGNDGKDGQAVLPADDPGRSEEATEDPAAAEEDDAAAEVVK